MPQLAKLFNTNMHQIYHIIHNFKFRRKKTKNLQDYAGIKDAKILEVELNFDLMKDEY